MEAKMCLGVARKDITPKVGGRLYGYGPDMYSTSVHDQLTATAFAFEYEEERVLMISVCVCLMNTELTNTLRREISEKYSLNYDNIIIAANHTHSGPALNNMTGWGDIDTDYYEAVFRPAVLEASKEALHSMRPVLMGVGVGPSQVGINRRALTNHTNATVLGQCEWGPYNPNMTVLSFKDETGDIIANLISYGAHGTAAGGNHEVTRDWMGIMIDALDTKTGGVTGFFNGAIGDVGPRLSNGDTVGDLSYVEELGAIAAEDAVRIFETITNYESVSMGVAATMLKLPLKERIPYEVAVEESKRRAKDVLNIGGKIASHYREVKASYENGYVEQEFREIPQTVVRVGNVIFVGFPYELFSEISMRINQCVPNAHVVSLSNVNGYMSYFPTQDQLCRGGYEIDSFKYSDIQCYMDDADFHLIRETVRNISQLERRG